MNKQVDDLFERLARGLFALEEVKRLVNDIVDAAVKEECEACAKVVDRLSDRYHETDIDGERTICAIAIAEAIRQRGQS